MTKRRIKWPPVIEAARKMASAELMTLRQLLYRLFTAGHVPNTKSAYKRLSLLTAEGRRIGTFPALVDRTRSILQAQTWDSPQAAKEWLAEVYRRDRTEGQKYHVVLGVEKDSLAALVELWFGDYGFPIAVLRGYSSQTYADELSDLIAEDERPTVLIYAGDFDPSGEDIERDLRDRVHGIDELRRIAVTPEVIERYALPEKPGKKTDSRAAAFELKHGRLVQVEVEALAPADLRFLFEQAILEFWDTDAHQAVLEQENMDTSELRP